MKNTLEVMYNRLSNTEECVSYLENRILEITQSEEQTERQMKKKKQKQYMRPMR